MSATTISAFTLLSASFLTTMPSSNFLRHAPNRTVTTPHVGTNVSRSSYPKRPRLSFTTLSPTHTPSPIAPELENSIDEWQSNIDEAAPPEDHSPPDDVIPDAETPEDGNAIARLVLVEEQEAAAAQHEIIGPDDDEPVDEDAELLATPEEIPHPQVECDIDEVNLAMSMRIEQYGITREAWSGLKNVFKLVKDVNQSQSQPVRIETVRVKFRHTVPMLPFLQKPLALNPAKFPNRLKTDGMLYSFNVPEIIRRTLLTPLKREQM